MNKVNYNRKLILEYKSYYILPKKNKKIFIAMNFATNC
jgi:hypothetical protein